MNLNVRIGKFQSGFHMLYESAEGSIRAGINNLELNTHNLNT